MDKANRNFDSKNAIRDRHGNITARNQYGLDAKGNPRPSPKPKRTAHEAYLDAMERDMLPIKQT